MELISNNKERGLYESLAELYSIIIVLNFLEKSFLRDTLQQVDVDNDNYTKSVSRLINQYNLALKNEEVKKSFVNLDSFFQKYDICCPLAKQRLEIGVPATIEHSFLGQDDSSRVSLASGNGANNGNNTGANGGGNNNNVSISAKAVAEATGNFITLMDAVKLNYRTKDQLHPLLSDLVTCTNKVLKNGEFEGRSKIIQWLIKLNNLDINERLSDDDSKEFLFDLDNAYKGFYACLN
ncbi:hypothetical protein PACTADRAFT_37568 [Pachysolen tannophilus NRRL Y-2460]|uniref:Vacuolar protein sorting-associated protein 28 n=1 Tax=Pachysolen tannophilus NRRL Y-2460 TaxID=669874 RepID=A0A1E4U116_PACTA|nr:hypothetical protein PACTADRAFT_37568 [Pachysolen tannophilus NRRL Y-2460]